MSASRYVPNHILTVRPGECCEVCEREPGAGDTVQVFDIGGGHAFACPHHPVEITPEWQTVTTLATVERTP